MANEMSIPEEAGKVIIPEEAGKVIKRGRGVVKVYQHSPFLIQMDTKIRRVSNKTGDMMLISKDSGEVLNDVAGFWQSEEVDATQFVKLFVQGVRALKELTNAGTKVFELLYTQMQAAPNRDMVNMAYWTINQNATPISERTYARGLSELVEKNFIAATPTFGLYWINPSFLWNGDRLTFVKEYVKKATKPAPKRVSFIDPNQQTLFPEGEGV